MLESDDNGESTEDMATEEHAEKPDHLMEATAEETTSLHDNIVLEHPGVQYYLYIDVVTVQNFNDFSQFYFLKLFRCSLCL